ncbi:ribonuclease G (RNase G) [Rhodospirillum rubrum F11]|uniref:Ribonuclease G (RNase G) n=1 Tax=Rhodospirillum rubrum (strain ATCC 11170 / ATH 1.1.1 / DSM 467 / LMG 4362 / NCIMB 8255 / S1) TaxID=269796 RepID=Q2RQN1_RHORT|nr:ribonuclease E/G [Rhodospirillum rubrum]ABC23564.1 ribonuclease G (RNase G) [Rhodospirillum rubrum ATCC 11170]AEO49302.1 ribonuclease G (RNase G) [Rhodospirillum rubrum F11]MBK5955239.1 ribonuclease E/G [Rhodospirillum rubrum]QXG79529.1 ribonuclease E/G [Rhodospirillum rubrum]
MADPGRQTYHVLVSDGPGETRWALLAGDTPVEVVFQRAHAVETGAIVAGRVTAAVPGHQALFVDLGRGPAGFLGAEDTPRGLPGEGALLAFQVLREAVAGKGPTVTAAPTLAGRLLVYTPYVPGVGLSPRAGSTAARKALRARITALLDPGEGVVARTIAGEASEAALRAELDHHRARWRAIGRALAASTRPGLLEAAPGPLGGWLDSLGDALRSVVADQGERAQALRRALAARGPDWPARVVIERADQPLFERWGVEEALEAALAVRLALPGGGAIAIEETAALTAIDVDAGGADRRLVAPVAAREIARQIRLRALAGQILIDFPRGARGPEESGLVALIEALAADPAGPRVLGVTRGGLVEVVRPRRRPPLSSLLTVPGGPPKLTAETALLAALRELVAGATRAPGARPHLRVGPRSGGLLATDLAQALAEVEAALGQAVAIDCFADHPEDRPEATFF